MTDNLNTTATTAAAILNGFDSQSATYAALHAGLDGFRTVTNDPAVNLRKAVSVAESAEKTPEASSAAVAVILGLSVALAGQGAATVAEILEGTATLPESGDRGYVLSLIGVRGLKGTDADGKPENRNGAIALAIYPAHSIDALTATEEGKAWLQIQADKEAGLVAFRRLRFAAGEATAQMLADAAQGMPATVADFIERARAASGESFAVFNALFTDFRKILANNAGTAASAAVLPTKKADVLSAIRSKAYAETYFPLLEEKNLFSMVGRAFAIAVANMKKNAEASGESFEYDPADILRWIEGRDTLNLVNRVEVKPEDLEAIDFSAFGI